ncbi:MAG: hypothetical protein ACRBFS_05845 [Aureispira sp.]
MSHSISRAYAMPFNNFNFDPSANMLYFLKRDVDQKGKKAFLKKEEKEEHYNNLILWDIDTQKKHFLFEQDIALTHRILGFYFECYYNEEECSIVFNREIAKINLEKLPQRALKDLLLIETVHLETKATYL